MEYARISYRMRYNTNDKLYKAMEILGGICKYFKCDLSEALEYGILDNEVVNER